MKKIAIIGSGFFGISSALILSKKNQVHIYEKNDSLLCGASRANQMRFHMGYHYPRSAKTLKEISKNSREFKNFFGVKIFGNTKNYYGISKYKSKTSFKTYLKFLKKNKLTYTQRGGRYFSHNVEGSILSKEKILNYFNIKKIIINKLKRNRNIKVFLKREFNKKFLKDYNHIIICTYDQNNKVLMKLGFKPKKKYKFELVEKIIVKLPKKYINKSFMILDGKFVCLDPYLGTKYHLLSDNLSSKLETVKSYLPKFKNKKMKYLNSPAFYCYNHSNFEKFIKNGKKFLPFLKDAKYIKSFFITRTLELNKEKTDERLSNIIKINKQVYTIFSGKWNTSIGVAKQLEDKLND